MPPSPVFGNPEGKLLTLEPASVGAAELVTTELEVSELVAADPVAESCASAGTTKLKPASAPATITSFFIRKMRRK